MIEIKCTHCGAIRDIVPDGPWLCAVCRRFNISPDIPADAREPADKRLRKMPRDWPEKRAEVILAKLAKAEDHREQIDIVARYLLWAYMKGRGTR